jgi:AcrR family transcriptional regulator
MKRRPAAGAFHPRKLPRQRRSLATVEALVQATARLLTERGYRGATTRLIAERAGVSVGSLYQYFPSRDALVTAVLERHIDEVLDAVGTLFQRQARAPLGQVVRRIVARVLELHERDHALHVILWEQLPRADRSAVFRKIDRVLSAHLRAFLEGRPELPRVDAVRAVDVLGRACLPLIHAREQGLGVSHERLTDDLVQLIVGYLRAAASSAELG